jgi:DNA repair photolyase
VWEHTFVRWENLTIEQEETARLPGYRDEAVVRHFEAPDAIPTRFYEIRAKSILNKVPEASQMPFRWTINPYRGCSHACSYCLSPATAVLLANGRTKPIADLEVGELIYGTQREGRYRRLRITAVHDKWASIKRSFVIELEDGTEITASGDHRFLTRRGWKFVTGSQQGRSRRPHLTTGSKMLGTGGFVTGPVIDADYRRGYLCGMLRGDAYLGQVPFERSDGSAGLSQRFRLALADQEALDRSREYLDLFEVATREFLFSSAAGTHRAMYAISAHGPARTEAIKALIRWPLLPPISWMKGFLAGSFDAEGGCSQGVWRLSNTDPVYLHWVRACLARFGFRYQVETRPGANRELGVVRLLGGMSEQLRFFLAVDPAISRKRSFDGKAIKSDAPLRVVAIHPTGATERLYDITTGTGDFIANGVVSHNCFARPTHTYLDFNAGRDFEREIVVKVNAPERLRAELARPSWTGEHIALGTNTDPYQWVEGRYQLMRGIWQAMIDAGNPGSILTKSPLLLRDLDLMTELNRRAEFGAALSIPTVEEKAWRATEPHTPNPRARLEAVATLTAAGIRTGVLVAPLMPGINDDPEQVREILRLCDEAGAAYVTGIALHLRGEVRQVFMEWLRAHRPDLVPRYRELYRRGAYAPVSERRRLAGLLRGPDQSPWERGRGIRRSAPEPALGAAEPASVGAEPMQARLFDT